MTGTARDGKVVLEIREITYAAANDMIDVCMYVMQIVDVCMCVYHPCALLRLCLRVCLCVEFALVHCLYACIVQPND